MLLKGALAVFIGFSSGAVIAGGVFALIAVIGIVPRMAQKTNTQKYAMLYEEAIIFGGLAGAVAQSFGLHIHTYWALSALLSFCGGIFFGCLAMSLAEALDAIPILTRRIRVQQGMFFFVLFFAMGKLMGSLLYFLVPGFYKLQ